MSVWRVFPHSPLYVYDGDGRGVCQCRTPENAVRIVEAANDRERLTHGIKAIAGCTLTGVDFGDYVQSACEDLLDGGWAECPKCGTAAHEGACVDAEAVNQ